MSENFSFLEFQSKETKNIDYNTLPLPYQSLGLDGNILQVNQQWLNALGYSREEIIGTPFVDILHPEEVECFKTKFSILQQKGSVSRIESRILNNYGTAIHFALEGTIEHDAAGGFRKTHFLLFEITEYKTRESIKQSESDVWARVFDTIDEIVTIQDTKLSIVKANKAAHELLSLNAGDLVGRNCYEIFSGESQPCSRCPLMVTLKNGREHSSVIRNTKLGKVFHVRSSLIRASGQGEGLLVHVARDITRDLETNNILQESNERFSKAFEANPAPMVISEIESGLFINVNQRWIDIFGYSREELIGKNSKDIGIWQDPSARDRAVEKLFNEASFHNFSITFVTKSGETRSALWSAEKININGQELMLSLINDVTEQKLAEQKLRESEEKFFLAFNASPDAININRLEDGLFIEANSGFTELTGFTKDDIRGKTSLDINIWHDPQDRTRLVQSLNEKGYCENLEAKFRRKDGRSITALMSARVISLENAPHIISITRDISKLRDAEQQVIEQKILFETMFNAIDDGIIIADTDRKILFANKGMEKTFGYLPEKLRGKTTEFLYATSDDYQITGKTAFGKDAVQREKLFVTMYKHRSGREFPGETFGVKLYDQNNKWIGNLGIMRDISLRLETEAERDRLIAAIEQTRDAIVITDKEANINYVNPAFEHITGYSYEEVLNKNPRILKSGEHDKYFYRDLWQKLNSGQTFQGRMVNKRKDGKMFTEETTISPIFDREGQVTNFIAVKRNITEQVLLELQLQQAQKMEAVGRLTGGVAHDFNNILGVIIGYAEMVLEEVDSTDNLHDPLEKILDAAEHSADIVRQLLAFSRKQTISPKIIDLNKAVLGMLKMLHRLIGEDIELSWIPDPEELLIKMDPVQIDQILANLCVNAKDAISGAGKIVIETTRATFDEDYCLQHIGFHPGEFVQLSVSDNGCGIDKKTQNHIFEPFFTTKELGRGTGLGLSTVYGIVKQNKGFINVYSELNRGTTFVVYFPSSDTENRESAKIAAAKNREIRGETILLVEDELSLLAMTQKMLERMGYTILAANRPSEAIKIAEEYSGDIDLVFTDVVMPEMTGKEMAERIKPLYPNVRVLFSSGYTANVIAHNGILEEGIQFIQKPYSKDALANKLRSILC